MLLTASANGCKNMALADAIKEVETAFRRNGVSVQYYGQTVFSSVIALPGTKASDVYATPIYQDESNHTILIVTATPKDVENAMTAITNLSDGDYAVRQRGCGTLRSLARDRKSLAILARAPQCRG